MRLAYPFDLPERRRVRVDFPLGWFRIRQIPVVAQQVQADTYLACGLVSETINHMVDTFVRDYLVERIEGMLEHRSSPATTRGSRWRPASVRVQGRIHRALHRAGRSGVAPDGEWIVP